MSAQTVILTGAAIGFGYLLFQKTRPHPSGAQQIQKYHKRALLTGMATAAGHRGATRYVQQGRYLNTLPAAQGRSYLVTRAMAEEQYQRNLRPGNFFVNN